MRALDDARHALEQGDVGGDLHLDPRPQHLDHHLAAVVQGGRVHLRDAGGRQRGGVEAGVGIRDASPEFALDQAAGDAAIERGHPVLQVGQFLGDVGGHQVAAGVSSSRSSSR